MRSSSPVFVVDVHIEGEGEIFRRAYKAGGHGEYYCKWDTTRVWDDTVPTDAPGVSVGRMLIATLYLTISRYDWSSIILF